jgi:hypothetical protein
METAAARKQITINALAVGARLVVQCKKDWRMAVVSTVSEERVVLQICSPSGRTYRKSCAVETVVDTSGAIPFLGDAASWREGFARYDSRW